MNTRRAPRLVRNSFAQFEPLEPRQLLATGFNPDGPVIATPAQAPTSMVSADFDGDAKPDLVTAVGKDIFFQRGFGGGRFAAPRLVIHLNTDAGLLGVGDFDGDSRPDLFSVQQGVVFGWHRLLLNTGFGQFVAVAYGRSGTAVEAVTVGNIDSDPMDEVLLKGRGPNIATLVIAEAPDEIRVLDPFITITLFPANVIPGPFIRFADLGPALFGYKLGTPLITNLLGGDANHIVIGGQDTDATTGFIQAYVFSNFTPVIGTSSGAQSILLPPALFEPSGDRIFVPGVVTAIGAADMNGDGKLDLVASTLQHPDNPLRIGQGDFIGRTLLLPRTGNPLNSLAFGTTQEMESRLLIQPDLLSRAGTPEYRLASLADFNSDGQIDAGLSIVEQFRLDFGMIAHTASFAQVLGAQITTSLYVSSIVAQVSSTFTSLALISRTHSFLAADIRRVGRPDLFVADGPSTTSPVNVRVIYNVNARPFVPHL